MTLLFLVFHFCIYNLTFCVRAENISYILQPNPVVVIIDPLSQFSSVGENAVLYCHINLTSDSQIKVDWRYNDKVLNISDGSNVNSNHTSIFDHTRNLYTSKLYIQNVSVNDEGYYECLVSDGLYTSEKSGSAMVTVSDRALLRIIDDTIKYREWTNVIKTHGQYVILSCGDMDGWDAVLWNKNGLNCTDYMTSKVKELSNGSLLIYNLTMEDEGIYECSFVFSGYIIEGSSYNISITMNASGIQEPQIFIDPVNITISVRRWSSVTCYILGFNISEYKIVWSAENGTLIQEDFNGYYSILSKPGEIDAVGIFSYQCEVNYSTGNHPYLSSTIWVRVESIPVITSTLQIRDVNTSHFEVYVYLECPVLEGSNITFTWYRNGVNITSSSNSTGYLEYEVPINSTSVGIYQCFIQNHVGRDTSISRRLERGFANPPKNFTCYAEDQSLNSSIPKIVLHWSPPNFINTDLYNYSINMRTRSNYSSYLTKPNYTSYEIYLTQEEENLVFDISLKNNVPIRNPDRTNAAAWCSILSTTDRWLVPSLEVTCPTSNASGTLKWRSPATDNPDMEIFHQNLTCACLQGNSVISCANISSSDPVSFSVDKKFANSLCIFGGNYSFKNYELLDIPPRICNPFNKTLLVNFSCIEPFPSAILLSLDTLSGTVFIDGHCISYDSLEVHRINFTWSSAIPKFTIEDSILNNSLCSFIAKSSGSPVIYELQFFCMENKFYYFPPTTEPTTTSVNIIDLSSTSPVLTDFPPTTEPTTTSVNIIDLSSTSPVLTGDTSDKSAIFNQVLIIVMVIISITIISLIIMILLCVRQKDDTNGRNVLHKNIADLFKESDKKEISLSEFESHGSIDEDAKSNITILQYLNGRNCESIQENCVYSTNQPDSIYFHLNSANSSGYNTEYHESGEYFFI